MTKLLHQDQFETATNAVISFSDVFPEDDRDFDAELTSQYRQLGVKPDNFTAVPIGKNPRLAQYGSVLVDDLVAERRRILAEALGLPCFNTEAASFASFDTSSLDLRNAAKGEHLGSTQVILNSAPRSKETTENGANGTDFYVAVTENGTEIYATPVSLLSALETRNRIIGLYRVPTADLPFTNGSQEQFRSSLITNVRLRPEVLKPVYEYVDRVALIRAKQTGRHPTLVPEQQNLVETAFVDKFGNVRLSVKDNDEFQQRLNEAKNSDNCVRLTFDDWRQNTRVRLVNCLRDLEDYETGLYQNVADSEDQYTRTGYWELVRKLPNPNQPWKLRTAAWRVGAHNPKNWDRKIEFHPLLNSNVDEFCGF